MVVTSLETRPGPYESTNDITRPDWLNDYPELAIDNRPFDVELWANVLSHKPWIWTLKPSETEKGFQYQETTINRLKKELYIDDIMPVAILFDENQPRIHLVSRDDLLLDKVDLVKKMDELGILPDRRKLYQNAYQALTRQENQHLRPR